MLFPLPATGGTTLKGGLRSVELAVASGLGEAAKPEKLLELLSGSEPAAGVAAGRLPLTEGDGGTGERYTALGEAKDGLLTSGLCHAS